MSASIRETLTDALNRPDPPIFDMDIYELCDRIGFDPDSLAGNCHAVSSMIVESGLAGPGARVARGHYKGYAGQHSWVVIENYDDDAELDLVIDATINGVRDGRNETGEPELFISLEPNTIDWDLDIAPCVGCHMIPEEHPNFTDEDPCEYCILPERPVWCYDEGGNTTIRKNMDAMTSYPEFSGEEIEIDIPDETRTFLTLAGYPPPYNTGRLIRIASSSTDNVGGKDNMRRIIVALDKANLGAFAPVDQRAAVGLER